MSLRSDRPASHAWIVAIRRAARSGVLAFTVAIAGCTGIDALHCGPGESPAIDDLLYFGMQRPGGRVDADEWQAFLRDVVTPRFPAGLSTWPVAGQWRADDGTIVREDSIALAIVHPDDADADASIRFIVGAYERRFAQDAVLRVRKRACMSL